MAARIEHHFGDVRDLPAVMAVIDSFKPDFIFHLAAQPIVSVSYSDPVDTITTNVVGTANVLEALRILNPECVAVMITSDKCYENVEWLWGYKETDHLGGRDIYSGSKGAAEVIIHSYYYSFFCTDCSSDFIPVQVFYYPYVPVAGFVFYSFRCVVGCVTCQYDKFHS